MLALSLFANYNHSQKDSLVGVNKCMSRYVLQCLECANVLPNPTNP